MVPAIMETTMEYNNNGNGNNHKVSFVPSLTNSLVMTSRSSNINYDTGNLNDMIFINDDNNNNPATMVTTMGIQQWQ